MYTVTQPTLATAHFMIALQKGGWGEEEEPKFWQAIEAAPADDRQVMKSVRLFWDQHFAQAAQRVSTQNLVHIVLDDEEFQKNKGEIKKAANLFAAIVERVLGETQLKSMLPNGFKNQLAYDEFNNLGFTALARACMDLR